MMKGNQKNLNPKQQGNKQAGQKNDNGRGSAQKKQGKQK